MKIHVKNPFEFVSELRLGPDLSSVPIHSETLTGDIVELIEEAIVNGVLSEALPANLESVQVELAPVWRNEPLVRTLDVLLTAEGNGHAVYKQTFATGRWVRSAGQAAVRLRQEGTLPEGQVAHQMLLAMRRGERDPLDVPPVELPLFTTQSLEDFGVRKLGKGNLAKDRAILVNHRLAADSVRRCEEAGPTEAGGAVLGKILRLDRPLPGCQSRFVTVLSTVVEDPRHVGEPLRFSFSPEGLAGAARFADLRGLGETVQTVLHTHGWQSQCGNCNQNSECPLAECTPSLQDYQLLESLFSSKATVLPIAGRKLGAEGRRPVLEIHRWNGGEMRPVTWREYED